MDMVVVLLLLLLLCGATHDTDLSPSTVKSRLPVLGRRKNKQGERCAQECQREVGSVYTEGRVFGERSEQVGSSREFMRDIVRLTS